MQFIVLSDVYCYRPGGDEVALMCNVFFTIELVKVLQESNHN